MELGAGGGSEHWEIPLGAAQSSSCPSHISHTPTLHSEPLQEHPRDQEKAPSPTSVLYCVPKLQLSLLRAPPGAPSFLSSHPQFSPCPRALCCNPHSILLQHHFILHFSNRNRGRARPSKRRGASVCHTSLDLSCRSGLGWKPAQTLCPSVPR